MIAAAMLVTLASTAIVVQDAVPLRAAPSDNAPVQAQLQQGDALELRGRKGDYLQVWDHRRERPGYVRAPQVREVGSAAADAPGLLAVLRFVRDTPGAEALGVAYAAAYLKAVPAREITAEPFDALGQMADRLARRASARGADARVAARVDGVAQYGIKFQSLEQDGSIRLCFDGEAWRDVLALPNASAEQRARAILGLTAHDCADATASRNPNEPLTQRQAQDVERAELLDRLGPTDWATLDEPLRNRIRLRRAGVWARVAHAQALRGESATAAGQRALQELAAVQKSELTEDDLADYREAAIRVGASRWAAEPMVTPATPTGARPTLVTRAGQPGETCVLLVDAAHGEKSPLLRRCTYGVAWLASMRVNPAGTAVALAVQPLATWRELWLMKKTPAGWTLDVLPPAAGNPLGSDMGYLEFAGWVPEASPKLLLAREQRVNGRVTRRFEVTQLASLSVTKQAGTPEQLAAFKRWRDPAWVRQTVSVR